MAYNNNNDYQNRPVMQKQDITGWIAHIQDLTGSHWKDAEIHLIWQQQPKEMQPVDFCRMMYIASKRGLDPLLRQIYATCRWDKNSQAYLSAIESTIDGFRLACDRTGEVDGMSEPEFEYRQVPSDDGTIVPVLHACKISLFRKGCTHPFTAKAFLSEYTAGNNVWVKMPHQMLSKCCEALVRRMAFPEALSGIYAREEMMQADDAPVMQAAMPAVTHTPAVIASTPVASIAAPCQVQTPGVIHGPIVQPPAVTAPQVTEPAPNAQTTTRRRRTTSTPPPPPAQTAPQAAPSASVPEIPTSVNVPAVPATTAADKYVCADTGNPIVDFVATDQTNYTRDWLYEYSVRTYGRALCAERLMSLKAAADAAKTAEPQVTAQQVIASQAASILNGQGASAA